MNSTLSSLASVDSFDAPPPVGLAPAPVDRDIVELAGRLFPGRLVRRFLRLAAAGTRAIALRGQRGCGKTEFAVHGACEALKRVTGADWAQEYCEPHTLRHAAEFFSRSNFTLKTGMTVESTYVTQTIQEAVAQNRPLLLVLDELSLLDPVGQGALLTLANSGLLHIQGNGTRLQVPHFLLLATMNTDGTGTLPLMPQLRDRLKFVDWSMMPADVTAAMLLRELERTQSRRLVFHDDPGLGITFENRPVSQEQAQAVAAAAEKISIVSAHRRDKPSLRALLVCLGLYKTAGDLTTAIDDIVQELTAELSMEDPQHRGARLEMLADFQEAFGVAQQQPRNGRRRL